MRLMRDASEDGRGMAVPRCGATALSTRRGLITGLVSLLAAPAIVRASSLEFVPRAPRPRPLGPGVWASIDGGINWEKCDDLGDGYHTAPFRVPPEAVEDFRVIVSPGTPGCISGIRIWG